MTSPLKEYRCHKTVQAAKIHDIYSTSLLLSADGENEHWIHLSQAYFEKHQPSIGGYFVQYEDGYQSFSPAEAFEAGYTLASDVTVTEQSIDELLAGAEVQFSVSFSKVTVAVVQIPSRGNFTIVGSSACVDPQRFDIQLGQKYAIEDVKRQLWQLEGYLLQQRFPANA